MSERREGRIRAIRAGLHTSAICRASENWVVNSIVISYIKSRLPERLSSSPTEAHPKSNPAILIPAKVTFPADDGGELDVAQLGGDVEVEVVDPEGLVVVEVLTPVEEADAVDPEPAGRPKNSRSRQVELDWTWGGYSIRKLTLVIVCKGNISQSQAPFNPEQKKPLTGVNNSAHPWGGTICCSCVINSTTCDTSKTVSSRRLEEYAELKKPLTLLILRDLGTYTDGEGAGGEGRSNNGLHRGAVEESLEGTITRVSSES